MVTPEEKQKRISAEKARLNKIFTQIDGAAKSAVQSLIDNAAFLTVTLQELQETIIDDGVVSKYQNGQNQWGTKKSPEVEVYNSMIKNHTNIIKQLAELVPKGKDRESNDELMHYLKR